MKAVPEAIRRRATPQSPPCNAVPEGTRSRTPPPKRHTEEPPMEEVAVEVDDAMVEPSFDAVHAWTPRARVIIQKDGRLLGKKKGERLGGSGRIGDILVMPNGRGRYH